MVKPPIGRPGDSLRAFAARLCGSAAMRRLIDPTLADLQHEYAEARQDNRIWRSRWIRIRGYVAFWSVLGRFTASRAVPVVREACTQDHGAVGRALATAATIAAICTTALMLPALLAVTRTGEDGRIYFPVTADKMLWLVLSLVPQGLLVAAAIAVPVGILCGLRGRPPASATRRLLVAIAVASALIGWFNADRIVPAANQAFRQFVSGRQLAPGANELTFSELRNALSAGQQQAGRSAALQRSLHMRSVAALAPLFLGVFIIALHSRGNGSRLRVCLAAAVVTSYIAFYIVINPSRYWNEGAPVPSYVLVWLPNFALGAITLLMAVRPNHQTSR